MNKISFCAHRGLSALIPENSLPSFAAAHSLGADEIEFDVRLTRDARMIVSHDAKLERISDGSGKVSDYTLEELRRLNIGAKQFWQVGFCTPEEVFALLAGKIRFNIHLKEHGEEGFLIKSLVRLAKRYHAKNSIYFAASAAELEYITRYASDIERAAVQLPRDTMPIFDMAKEYGCSRVQFWYGMFDAETVKRMHRNNISCNLYYADTAEGFDNYFSMGIDTILTNRMDIAKEYRKSQLG